MGEEQIANAAKSFWFHPATGDFYLIAEDEEVPAGDFELRNLKGGKRLVDEEAVGRFATDAKEAKEHLAGQVFGGIAKFGVELGERAESG